MTGDLATVRENGATSGVGVLASFTYDAIGGRTGVTPGNGTSTAYTYDNVERLASLSHDLGGTTNDVSTTFTYNPADQIASLTRSNDLYAWTGHGSGSTASVANGLNQLATIGGAATTHDAGGNLTLDPTSGKSYGYTAENMLSSATPGVTLYHDGLDRLAEYDTAVSTRFVFDGANAAAEIDNPAGAIQRRYVWGDGADELLVDYVGSGTATRRFTHADERGSIVALSDSSGNMVAINRYDEYGKPQGTNVGRFQYTGQMWLGEAGVYNYKARAYAPQIGRFMQTDPIGVEGGINLYAYVGNDPVNWVDPSGLVATQCKSTPTSTDNGAIVVTATKPCAEPVDPNAHRSFWLINTPEGAYERQQNVCSRPLSGSANRGQTVNSRRAQVRRELAEQIDIAKKTGGDLSAAYSFEIGRVSSRLEPGGTWIKGGTSKEDGNILYGAISAELGIPLVGATGFGTVDEIIDDTLGIVGIRPYDGNWGPDSQVAKDQIASGARCPG